MYNQATILRKMRCQKCGNNQLQEYHLFCFQCGESLSKAKSLLATSTQQTSPLLKSSTGKILILFNSAKHFVLAGNLTAFQCHPFTTRRYKNLSLKLSLLPRLWNSVIISNLAFDDKYGLELAQYLQNATLVLDCQGIYIVTVFDAILTSRQTLEKLQ